MITIRVDGISQAVTQLRAIPEHLKEAVIGDMAQLAFEKMQAGAGRHRGRTGFLFKSIYKRPIKDGQEVGHDPDLLTVDWRGGTNRAVFVLFGTRPHKILPKNRKALRWAHGNDFIFAKSVKHPGYIGDDYMTAAAQEAIKAFEQIVDKRMKDAPKE